MAEVEAMRAAFKLGQATTWIIGPRHGWVYLAGQGAGHGSVSGRTTNYEGQRSTLFDACIVPSGAENISVRRTAVAFKGYGKLSDILRLLVPLIWRR